MLTCRLLGAVGVRVDNQPIDLGLPRQRALLAILLVEANRLVTVKTMIDRVWADQAPVRAAHALYAGVSKLRRALAPSSLDVVRRTGGYVIQIDPAAIDLHCFRALCARAHRAGSDEDAAALLDEALALWQGEAFAGLDTPWLSSLRVSLHSENLNAVLNRNDAYLRLGRQTQLLPELADLRAAHPLDERLAGQHMLALHRCGHSPDALTHYHDLRHNLAEELGIDPSPELQELHEHILLNDPALRRPPPVLPAPASSAAVVPFELPADTLHFTGRAEHLTRLLDLRPSHDHDDDDEVSGPRTVVVTAVEGMAGIGKTALAVHAAHQLTDRFPDGVLFTDLHGFTPGAEPTPPKQALDRLLRGLGVPGPQIPPDLEARVGLYRSVLARRRVLIVLDNAAHETQLAPLLPATPGCRVIVTSRRRLAGLDDAAHLIVPAMPVAEAAELFRGLAGDRVTPADHHSVDRIVALCGQLPLAIRITAARLRLTPAGTAATLCAELEDALGTGRGLQWLSDGHRAVGRALASSYRHLTDDQQRVFRLAGLHPGPSLEPYAMAALADTTVADARWLLDELHSASLLDQPAHRRYALQDLVAAYATTLAADLPDRHTALNRLYEHYAATSSRAMNLTRPWEADERPRPPTTHTPTPTVSDREQAQAWLDTETDNLLAAAHRAATCHRADHTLHQSATLHQHLRTRGHYDRAVLLHQEALASTRRTGNDAAERVALISLGTIHRLQGRHGLAADCFEQARASARRTADHATEQDALVGLGFVHHMQGRHGSAANCFERALASARQTGNHAVELHALNGLSYVHHIQGRDGPAADCFEQALASARQTGNHAVEHDALRGLGTVHGLHGRYRPAADCFEQALAIARQTGNQTAEHDALISLGTIHRLQAWYGPAANCFEQAAASARQTGNRNAEQYALNGLGHVHRLQGLHGAASDCFEQALAIARQTGGRNGQFEAHHGLGRVHHATGNHHDALHHQQTALQLAVDLDQPADQARAHDGLAHTHLALNNPGQARHHWHTALDLLTSIDTDHTEEPDVTAPAIRAHLLDLNNPTTGTDTTQS